MSGKKFDQDKPDWTLLPVGPAEGVIRVLEHGAAKYGRNNWREVQDGDRRYLAALLRHAMALVAGEVYDSESGLKHADHVACNALFLSQFQSEDV